MAVDLVVIGMAVFFFAALPIIRSSISFSLKDFNIPQWLRFALGMLLHNLEVNFLLYYAREPLKHGLCMDHLAAWNSCLGLLILQISVGYVGLHGGQLYYTQHGIEQWWQVWVQGCIPAQCWFPPPCSIESEPSANSASDVSDSSPNLIQKAADEHNKQKSNKTNNSGFSIRRSSKSFVKRGRKDYFVLIIKYLSFIALGRCLYQFTGHFFGLPFDDKVKSMADISLYWPTNQEEMKEVSWNFIRLESAIQHISFLTYWQAIGYCLLVPLAFGGDNIEVTEPWDAMATYFCTTVRGFWRHWSRPVGEFLKYAVYLPLGGNQQYAAISVASCFILNSWGHIQYSRVLLGPDSDADMLGWVLAFGGLGSAIVFETIVEKMVFGKLSRGSKPIWFQAMGFTLLHISTVLAMYFVRQTFNDTLSEEIIQIGYLTRFI